MLVCLSTLTPEAEQLLALAMYPDPVRVAAQLDSYRSDLARQVFGWQINDHMVAAIGLHVDEAGATILHIGTDPAQRRHGYARQLVYAVAPELKTDHLMAETDDDAVGFYRELGFEIESLGEQFGRQRYRCVRRSSQP